MQQHAINFYEPIRYVVVTEGEQYELLIPMEPTALSAQSRDLSDVLKAIAAPQFEVYMSETSGWRGVYGVSDTDTVHEEILTGQMATILDVLQLVRKYQPRENNDNYRENQEIGDVLIRAYRAWRTQKKELLRRSLRNGICNSESDELQQKIAVVDEIVDSFCTDLMRDIFRMYVQRGFDEKQTAYMLHISMSTYHRHWRALKCRVGIAVLERFQGNKTLFEKFLVGTPTVECLIG